MFDMLKRNRPVVTISLPESDEAAENEAESKTPEAEENSPPTPEDKKEGSIESPPLTPVSEGTTEEVTDEPSTEEPTVEEASDATVAEGSALRTDNNQSSSEETEEVITESEEENPNPREMEPVIERLNHNIYKMWLLFWVAAIAFGIIGYYLNPQQGLVAIHSETETNDESHILLMPREKWDDNAGVVLKVSSFVAERVIILQTETDSCDSITTCPKLLNRMKTEEGILVYNFLVATDGCIYEALGWQEPSPIFPESRTLVVGFIGNYETVAPSAMQLRQLKSLLDVSGELKYLEESYTIVGKKQTIMPSKLFAYLAAFDHWDKENSDDADDDNMEVEFGPFPIFED